MQQPQRLPFSPPAANGFARPQSQPQQQQHSAHKHAAAAASSAHKPQRPQSANAQPARPSPPAAQSHPQQRPSTPSHSKPQQPPHMNGTPRPASSPSSVIVGSGSGKVVMFPASASADDDDDSYMHDSASHVPQSRVDEKLRATNILPRTIAFKKSAAPFSSSALPQPAQSAQQQPNKPQQPQANGFAHKPPQPQQQQQPKFNGTPQKQLHPQQHHQPKQMNGGLSPAGSLKKSHSTGSVPAAPAAKLGSPSFHARALSTPVPVAPVHHSKDPNQFRWPKKYLFPSSAVSGLLSWQGNMTRIGLGLNNLGNTCFLNAVLQALAYTPPLANYLRKKEHSRTCRVKTKEQPDKFCLFCALESTVNSMGGGAASKQPSSGGGNYGHGALAPRLIVSRMRAIHRDFHLGQQEDSHEFLRFVIEMLQRNDLAAYGGTALVKDVRIQETTFLFGVFGGYFRSQIKCLTPGCHFKSNTYDTFLDLSLELNHVSSIHQALQSFTRPERLSEDNLYNCSRCKKKVVASKQLSIFKPPAVLVVHLKRFQFAGAFGGKINKPIDFKERLSLGAFTSDRETDPTYSLYAVLVHSGHSIHSGHYYCYVKSPAGQWFEMDDSSVRQVNIQTVLSQRAYILFYVRTAMETLPIAAPSPGVSPAMGPVQVGLGHAKLAELNLAAAAAHAAAKMKAGSSPQIANGALKPKPSAAAAMSLDSSGDSDEGDSDEGDSDSDVDPSAKPDPPRVHKRIDMSTSSSSDGEDDDAEEEDADVAVEDDVDDDGMAAAASDEEAEEERRANILRWASRAAKFTKRSRSHASLLTKYALNLVPSGGGLHPFAVYGTLHMKPPMSRMQNGTRKRRRVVIDDDEEEEEEAEEEANAASSDSDEEDLSDSEMSPADSSPEPAKKPTAAAAAVPAKKQRTETAAAALSSSASAAKPQPVWFNDNNTPPSPSAIPAAPVAAHSSKPFAVAASSAAASKPSPPPTAAASSSAAAPAASNPFASGPVILSRSAFDPRLLQRQYSSTQFGAPVGDWETTGQEDTSAKYAAKRKQDRTNSMLTKTTKEKDQWDEELDKGHVRKTKTGKSTALVADGSGAAPANLFQRFQSNRDGAKADAKSGLTPQKGGRDGRGGGGGGSDKKSKRGAQHHQSAKGFMSHKERNAMKKKGGGKGPKGPRDFQA